jgi:hypothetical protein
MDSTKSVPGHVMPNLCFCIWWDLWVTSCVLVQSVHEISMQYFSCLGGPGAVSTKSAPGHIAPNFCFSFQCDMWVI